MSVDEAQMQEYFDQLGERNPDNIIEWYEKLGKLNLSDQTRSDFEKWRVEQLKKQIANMPVATVSDIANGIKMTDFTTEAPGKKYSLADFCNALWAGKVPDVPLGSYGTDIQIALRPSVNTLSVRAPPQDGKGITTTFFHPYFVALVPSVTPNRASGVPQPPTIALQLGVLVSSAANGPVPSPDWSETGFVMLLNPVDRSLWIAFDYTPLDELGEVAQLPLPTADEPTAPATALAETKFDVAMLMDGDAVARWDLAQDLDLSVTSNKTASICGLTAAVVEETVVAAMLARKQPPPVTPPAFPPAA